ncbi:P-II family nitrogen regulator [Geomesophilobacter sediminis]|uniref:P-II family nitrogen regulator n=1 Tax=Geomesophilobacter sediminis TaxID=2798584 RepID=A0A8J7J315_9BACT|nr:P-II family nitrogen regulator [Geomesophilobacter sediminis]MBJ6725188.1 P-II family nitrogen regulator [Geomesophilobacter sediminis]
MKLIEAVINRLKLPEVRSALDELGVVDCMESSVVCHGSPARIMVFRGAKFVADVAEKVKLEIVSADESVERIIDAIGSIGKTGRPGDCRIAIRPYLEVT